MTTALFDNDNTLTINLADGRTESINLNDFEFGKRRNSGIKLVDADLKNTILLVKEFGELNYTLVVYTTSTTVMFYVHTNKGDPLRRLVQVNTKVIGVWLTKRKLRLLTTTLIEDYYDALKRQKYTQFIRADENNQCPVHIPIVSSRTTSRTSRLKRYMYYIRSVRLTSFLVDDLVAQEDTRINAPIQFSIERGSEVAAMSYSLVKLTKGYKNTRFYYAPMTTTTKHDFAIHVRRGVYGALVLVRRPLESIERTAAYRVLQSNLVAGVLYYAAKVYRVLPFKKINIYYEKYSSQIDEGAFDTFMKANVEGRNSKQFFIIRSDVADYDKVSDVQNVVVKDTFRAHWAIYRASWMVGTEAPGHASVIRSNNKYLRWSLSSKKTIFLQHGVTYMKFHGSNSAYLPGRDAHPDYMVVGSNKEATVVTSMLDIPSERLIVSGLPVFDSIKYGHINETSLDVATVMLTWRPYEVDIDDFSKTSYYAYTKTAYQELAKRMPQSQVRIIAHPLVRSALEATDMKDSLWSGSIKDALAESKLLITDYSSVCYNSFYQGAGLVFFQPDLERYEEDNGALIPADDEYIGPRAFSDKELSSILSATIKDDKINLKSLRTKRYVDNYTLINEFNDGKNVSRIVNKLIKMSIL